MKVYRWRDIEKGTLTAAQLAAGDRWAEKEIARVTLRERRNGTAREVLVRREGRRVILDPADEWSVEFRACLGAWSGEIPRPRQQKVRV